MIGKAARLSSGGTFDLTVLKADWCGRDGPLAVARLCTSNGCRGFLVTPNGRAVASLSLLMGRTTGVIFGLNWRLWRWYYWRSCRCSGGRPGVQVMKLHKLNPLGGCGVLS